MMDEIRDQDAEVLRKQLGNLRALLVISVLMTEATDEEQILRLAASAAPALGRWRIEGYGFSDGSWRPAGADAPARMPAGLGELLAALGEGSGEFRQPGWTWSWAFPLRSVVGVFGHMIAVSDEPPSADDQFLIQVVAQQAGVAVSNARLHAGERVAAAELVAANAALEGTIATLRRSMAIHERLTKAAVAAEGQSGIAEALHELTGMSVAIEDRHGNLRGWAGPGRPDPYPRESYARREQLLRRLMRVSGPVRDGARLTLLASPRPGVLGVLSLIDPDCRADAADLVALEHGATVLSVELARVRGIADAELRLRRDLVHDLMTGTDNQSADLRAEALGYDLRRPHRVVVIEGRGRTRSEDGLLHAVRRVIRDRQLPALQDTLSGAVVVVTGHEIDWEEIRTAILTELGGGRCAIGVGGICARPSELPRSLREGQLALRLQGGLVAGDRVCEYHKLGVFRMFAAIPNLSEVEGFVREWLGTLLDYDQRRGAELVSTLTQYLEHGGNYEATAAELSVHRSTLKYRLQRMRELTGLDINDPDVRFNMQLATRAWTTLQALRERPEQPGRGG
jgi:sugar diacid utilization regulator